MTSDFAPLSYSDGLARLSSGDYANHLCWLAGRAALLLRRTAAGVSPDSPRIAALVENARSLVTSLREAAQREPTNDRDLTVRQLIPVLVWRTTIQPRAELHDLTERLDAAIGGNTAPEDQHEVADLLEEFVDLLRQHVALSFARVDVS